MRNRAWHQRIGAAAGRGAITALLTGAVQVLGGGIAAAQETGYTASFFVGHTSVPGATFDSVYVFNSVDLSGGPLRLTVSVPFVRQHTVTDAAIDPFDGTIIDATDTTSTGFGDPLARVDVTLVHDRSAALLIGVAGSVKLPVVDAASGRGTGKADYAVGASIFKGVGRTSLLLDALYWKYGDPDGVDFEDALSYSVGVARLLGSGRVSTIMSLSGFTAGFGDLAPPAQLNVGLLTVVGRRHSLAITAGIGLTESATDFSVGTSWRIAR